MPQRPRYRRYRIYLPISLICLSPFLLGSVFSIIVLLLVLGLLFALFVEHRTKGGIIMPQPAFGLLAILLVIAFGLLPLPHALAQILSPVGTETRDFVLGESSFSPLSLDLPATALGVLLSFAVFLSFLIGVNSTTRKDRWLQVLSLIGGLGGLMAFVIAAHEMNELTAVYAFYPVVAKLTGPLINPNNVAALSSLSALISIGVALHADNKARPWLIASAVASIIILPLTGSRGGIASFIAGLLALALWELRVKSGRRAAWRAGIGVFLVAVAGSFFWGRAALDSLARDIKVTMWLDTTQLANDFAWVGVGRGAFGAVFPRYQSFPELFTVKSAEMLPLSIVSETGVLGLLASSFFLLAVVRTLRTRALAPTERGAVVAFFAALLHDLADFSLDIAGVALPVFLVAGVLCGRTETPRKASSSVLIAVLGLLIVPASIWAIIQDKDSAKARLESAMSVDAVKEIAAQELALRPSDGYLAMAAAARLLVLQEPKASLYFINRARYLLPSATAPHLLAARALRKMGRLSQARIEYRSAFTLLSDDTIKEAFAIARNEQEMRQLIHPNKRFRSALAGLLQQQTRGREALNLWWGVVQQERDSADGWSTLGEMALSISEYEEAEAAAEVLYRLSDVRAVSLFARAKASQKMPLEAISALERGVTEWPKEVGLWLYLAQLRFEQREIEAALSALDTARLLAPQDTKVLLLRGKILTAQERFQSALAAYQEALEVEPRSIEIRVTLAKLYETLGKNRDAVGIYRALAEENPAYQAEVDRLRK